MRGKGSIFCALEIVMSASDIQTTTAILQIRKGPVLGWNGPWGQQRQVRGTCILDDVIVPLNQPLLPLALLLM